MNFAVFKDTLISLLSTHLDPNVTITPKHITKNNNNKREAIVISIKDSPIAPTFYLDNLYNDYLQGKPLDLIVESIETLYQNADFSISGEIADFTDFSKFKNRIIYRLINRKKNESLLSDVPHYIYLDLAIIFCALVETKDNSQASFIIHSSHSDAWQVSRSDLLELAKENTPLLLPPQICRLADMLKELQPETSDIGELINVDMQEPVFYVMTNSMKINGASTLLYENVLLEFANKMDTDFYVLPSSVHETLLLPISEKFPSEQINEIIREGNECLISPEEYLSDHYYYFDRKQNMLSCG
ncbi:MAG: DUF5688 family protein [Lachnospiraceae bacterium]|nr:DUF5688 family protein [Lachnospiraceae bacterium]